MRSATNYPVNWRRPKRASWLVLCSLLSGCSSDECETVVACDIRQRDCQERTGKVLACLRGSGSVLPEITVVDAEGYIDRQIAEVTGSPEPPEAQNLRRSLGLFGLMDPDAEPAAVEREYWANVAAFFSGEDQRVTILDRGTALDRPESVTLLVHELVHALQSSENPDDGALDCCDNYDQFLAFRALVEGEALLYQDLATVYGYGDDPDELEWDEIFRGFRAVAWHDLRSTANAFELATLHFPYAFGGDYVNRAHRSGGNALVRGLLHDGPRTTRQLLFGYGVEPPRGVDWQEHPDEVGYPLLSPEYEGVATLHLGALLFEAFESSRGAGGFGDSGYLGDVMTLFVNQDSGEVAGFWRLRFESEQQAGSLSARLDGPLMAARADGRDLILVASETTALTDSLAAELEFGPVPAPEPEMEPDGAPAALERIACVRPAPAR
jgi:hypothetical protein